MILFVNTGNTCYLNSVLQCLLSIEPFCENLNKQVGQTPESKMINMFSSLVDFSKRQTVTTTNIGNLKILLSNFNTYLFGNIQQQDAHEAVVAILDIIHNSCKDERKIVYNLIKNENWKRSFNVWKKNAEIFGYSFVTEYFSGQFKSLVSCDNCNYESVNFDVYNNITLQIPKYIQIPDIADCFSDFIRPESLTDATCEKCKSKKLQKRTTLWKFPDIMIVNLKRYEPTNISGVYSRLNLDVEVDQFLNFKNDGMLHEYKLVSLIDHHGSSPRSGHYSCKRLVDDKWFLVDDENIMGPIPGPKISKTAYLLFYKKIKSVE
jgi:ubiquitin carboxyl-terminal hydrolase 36/42